MDYVPILSGEIGNGDSFVEIVRDFVQFLVEGRVPMALRVGIGGGS